MNTFHQIKAIIWDLDDTLWQGSLAENDTLSPYQALISLIPELDRSGIIQAICSKNDAARATHELQKIGIAEYFVFSRIDFLPKGQNITAIIADLQLRPANVLFVDDHPANLEEAVYYNEGLQIADPREAEFLPALRQLVKDAPGNASRLDFYRLLESKQSARELFSDNEAFLRDSQIVINLLRNPADMTYRDRVVELANRTNQLNFTRSRFPDQNSIEAYFDSADSMHRHHGAVFVHDKFGHYGLVGFYGFDERQRSLEHFYFSCRILNMGVEHAVYQHLREQYGLAAFPAMETHASAAAPVTVQQGLDATTQDYVQTELETQHHYPTAIIAGCSSGIIAHYLPASARPARFLNFHLSQPTLAADNFDHLIYALYSDYITKGWSRRKIFSYRRFADNLGKLIASYPEKRLTLLLGSERYPMPPKAWGKKLEDALLHGRSLRRVKRCNAIARRLAQQHEQVEVVEMGDYVLSAEEQIDPRHFERVVIQRMAQSLRSP